MRILNFCSSVANFTFDLVPVIAPLYRGNQLVKALKESSENNQEYTQAPSNRLFHRITGQIYYRETEEKAKTASNHFAFSNIVSFAAAWGLTALKVITATQGLLGAGIVGANFLVTLYRLTPSKAPAAKLDPEVPLPDTASVADV